MNYSFSLIVPTLKREVEFNVLCQSLVKQTYKNFDLIVVDQNDTDIVEKVIEKYKNSLKIIYIKNSQIGLSKNRNIGLTYAQGDIIAFPDDDCEYKPDTLQIVNEFFINNNYNLFTFNTEDKVSGKKNFGNKKHRITFLNFYRSGISFTIFIKRAALSGFKFDEQLGIGARFGAGEETDLIIYIISKGNCGFYDGSYSIYHPKTTKNYDSNRAYNYGMGFGALFKKIIVCYKKYFLFFHFGWYILKNIIALFIKNKRKYYFYSLKGKIIGFLTYKG